MSLTNTTFPNHNPSAYQVDEHDVVSCPPDLWPMIKEWLARNVERAT